MWMHKWQQSWQKRWQILKLGAKSFPSPVSKSTDMVVHGRKGGKKLKQAQELLDNDKIKDELDFYSSKRKGIHTRT